MTKRIELDDLDIEVSAQQLEENGRIPLTTIWRWNTPEEASAFLEGVEWVNDGASKAWIDGEDSSDVLVHDDESSYEPEEWPIVRHGGE